MSRGHRWLLLAALYLAQGLPYGFFTQALPVLLREQGLSLKAIGATSLLYLPWALKFLWAPLVDGHGTRRDWLLPLQVASTLAAAALALADIGSGLGWLFAAVLLFNLLTATQDIATDGLAVNLLGPRERGLGNGIQVGAYRVGMMLGGGLLLWLFARHGWTAMALVMAAMLALTIVPVLGLREAGRPRPPPASLRDELARGWAQRLRRPGLAAFIGLIGLYKLGDSMGAAMVGPFMHDAGMSKELIAWVKGTLGSAAALAGAGLGALYAWRAGRRSALLYCGLAQTASLLPYALAAAGVGGHGLIAAGCIAEHVLGGMATVALFTLMMDASEPAHAGTDYTLLACALVLVQGAASILAGLVADAGGYALLFVLGLGLSGLGCLALVQALDRGHGPRRLAEVWPPRA
ncbi:MFS transporter [Fontimonas sp. SYSU GA230001]|uniref:MFS transporter n=1 Tax=Fontimonas sp. SYSU GA230001 TaxID=3142450 RepID=UPI0032B450DD